MVFNLLNELKHDPAVKILALSLNDGFLARRLQQAGVETYVIPETENSFARILWKAARLFRNRQVDVIHSHRYKENALGFMLSRIRGIKGLITTLHGLSETAHDGRSGEKRIGVRGTLDYTMLRQFFTRIVAVSGEMERTLTEEFSFRPEKVEVIYNGISLPANVAGTNESGRDHFHIGTVGRMVWIKGLDLFIEIAAEVRRQTDKVRFSILGEGPLRDELMRKSKDLQLEDCMEVLPPRVDPFAYYRMLDLYLNTSRHEGIPLSILEAMACGRPVVAAKVGGIPEIILHGEHGLLVEGRSPRGFAGACLELMENRSLRTTLAEKALKRVECHFSASRMAESYKNLYQQICGTLRFQFQIVEGSRQ